MHHVEAAKAIQALIPGSRVIVGSDSITHVAVGTSEVEAISLIDDVSDADMDFAVKWAKKKGRKGGKGC